MYEEIKATNPMKMNMSRYYLKSLLMRVDQVSDWHNYLSFAHYFTNSTMYFYINLIWHLLLLLLVQLVTFLHYNAIAIFWR